MSELVYFFEYPDNVIYVGYTSSHPARFNQHRNKGAKLLAVLRGYKIDETRIHDYFYFCKRRPSQYSGNEIRSYVKWLLYRRYASDAPEDALNKPRYNFDDWGPHRNGQLYEDQNGQLSILELTSRIALENEDWYTPREVVEAAREAMGCIDLDPSSCIEANEWIRAKKIYDINVDGLAANHKWIGNVWLNPPYGGAAGQFVSRLIDEVKKGNVKQAITCLNLGQTDARWFSPIWETAALHAIWKKRISFLPPGGSGLPAKSPVNGTILSYFGESSDRFMEAFSPFSRIIKVVL